MSGELDWTCIGGSGCGLLQKRETTGELTQTRQNKNPPTPEHKTRHEFRKNILITILLLLVVVVLVVILVIVVIVLIVIIVVIVILLVE
jgi:Flp pilus assembly protein TadB